MKKHRESGKGHKGHKGGKGSKGCLHKKRSHRKKSPWFSEVMARRNPRLGRGETRYIILDALKDEERHGYNIIRSIEEKTDGVYRPSPGTVYPVLQLLEESKLITVIEEDKNKRYQITDMGREELESNRQLLEDLYEDIGQGVSEEQEVFFEDVYKRLLFMFRSISRAFQKGTLAPDKADKIKEIIHKAIEQVEEVLT